MNKKTVSVIIFLVLAAIVFLQKKFVTTDTDGEFNRNPQKLIYTKHAKCRMGCRFFTKNEVREILEKGVINHKKSRPNDKPCPSFALEGRTSDGQQARMVFATCDNNTLKLVTCIDLETDYKCDCY